MVGELSSDRGASQSQGTSITGWFRTIVDAWSDVGVELRDSKRVIEDAETVSNRGGDTMGGKLQGSSVLNLSTSDSGVLRAIADQEYGSRVDSTLDLEKEIAKRVASNIS